MRIPNRAWAKMDEEWNRRMGPLSEALSPAGLGPPYPPTVDDGARRRMDTFLREPGTVRLPASCPPPASS